MTFAACIPIILMSEGGYSNNPNDPGGPTNLGITQQTLSGWLGHPATVADVQGLTQATVEPLYETEYYNAAHCQQLAAGVDLMIFDEAVNQGVGRAIRSLQQAVGVTADGGFGPITLAAAQAAKPVDTINRVHDIRAAFYRGLSDFDIFGVGWISRIDRTRTLALAMAAPTKP
ncbi:MAG TPA: glycosyl hydrolase 108 family protein [Caulobacteraceae bacterium]